MADNVAAENPGVNFVRPCVLCPHMQRITLPKIVASLETLSPQVEVDNRIVHAARRAVKRMLAVSAPAHKNWTVSHPPRKTSGQVFSSTFT